MCDENIRKKKIDVFLIIFPFSFFLFSVVIFPVDLDFFPYLGFFNANFNVASYLFILTTIFSFIFKEYKYYWPYIWLSFSIYYFIIKIIPGSYEKIFREFSYIMNLEISCRFNINLSITSEQFIILITNIILYLFLIYIFKVKKTKIFLILFVYFYVFCLYVIFPYISIAEIITIQNVNIKSGGMFIENNIKLFILLNSFFSVIFLLVFLYSSIKIKKVYICIIFIVLNFCSINALSLNHIFFNKVLNGNFSVAFSELFFLINNYINIFLMKSNLVYYILFLFILYKLGRKEKN